MEIYNEMINDLLDSKKKNLELRESVRKGIFVDNLTEIAVDSSEKVSNIIKQGDGVKIIAETKLNEHSSRSHTIFRVNIETNKKIDGKNKILYSQFNLVDLAGSENVSKAKTDGIRMKEGSNINKSLLALSMVIYKLSSNQKSFINYRDSKLTRLLQSALSGNSKTTIICTISQNTLSYQETLNTLNFGTKAKTIKTIIKINELIDEKTKIIQENTELKSKIKKLEDIVSEKTDPVKNEKFKINDCSMIVDDNVVENAKNQKNDILINLEKEVTNLKKMLFNGNQNQEEDDETYNFSKPNQANYFGFSANKMSSNRKKKVNDENDLGNCSSYFKRCLTDKSLNHFNNVNGFNPNFSFLKQQHYPSNFDVDNDYQYKSNDYSIVLFENEELKKNLYETRSNFIEVLKSKDNIIKSLSYNHNAIVEKCDKILIENEENFMNLKSQFDKTREELLEKEEEIKNLNEKINNSDNNNINLQEEKIKLTKELKEFMNQTKRKHTDESFIELKKKYDEAVVINDKMGLEIKQQSARNNDLVKSLEKVNDEKKNLKLTNDNLNSEMFSQKARHDMLEKNNEVLNNDISRLKNEIISYRNEIATNKDKLNLQKTELSQNKAAYDKLTSELNKLKFDFDKLNKNYQEFSKKNEEIQIKLTKYEKGVFNESRVLELEKKIEFQNSQILQLDLSLSDYKQKMKKLEEVDIKEYERIIEESLTRINELQTNISLTQEKNTYLENIIKISDVNKFTPSHDSSSSQKKLNIGTLDENEKENFNNPEDNCFTNKKRKKLSKVYQNILDKKLLNGSENGGPNKI